MDFVKEFLEIKSTDSDEELTDALLFLSVAVLSEIVLDKVHFKRNKDLKVFTNDVLLTNYKDYLFDSRPTLYARIVKDLRTYRVKNPGHFLRLENNIQQFLSLKHKETDKDTNEEDKKDANEKKGNIRKVIKE
ncbi:hypothetical protein P5G51_000945 [Virgibacillus sp. 179-BFC.A HS]|uniref:Uncharacterized protein n=1 Tax=Tigheibacillus jepli TaxID=3035914 RepID=A0ABU5CD12_9BACI|nr:hypothetical protein [Virgibacillus sp. 179-BFC.A HS]MDY0404161.1 hypothetical protein [Virgibacillus sp. 179-BFC.A HS]